jgi:hypothetical protein
MKTQMSIVTKLHLKKFMMQFKLLAMSFNILIQMKLNFHKINAFFSSIDKLSSLVM